MLACHCGTNGHAVNSVNCPEHGYITIKPAEHIRLQTIERAARAYVDAVNKEALPKGCHEWDGAEEQTLEALHAALGFRD